MLMNKTQLDYGITDEMIEKKIEDHPQATPLIKRIAEFFGELLEELEFDCDTVD